ncbi:related to Prenylated Rab acceptor 1 [Saccharomycodes ludwigii]|uniref:PRA1 family protein n=1 Tax=Saccharomycodes ludwigii TaxID=36035 RepID=A0A376B312_9ASCO|nr:hypothetical protein SCDLUD_002772 [Saccharomycodes ludwigii]KAH3901282.1 hypothetical protein SCDLUD_002772 [Saccharomycodes ludwigii]SSD59063.1 related to Prenylated Rab acceptor 1 [Saccharomycodes ludwigii]
MDSIQQPQSQQLTTTLTTQFGSFIKNLSIENIKTEFYNVQAKFSNLRQPQDFFDVKRISKPANFSEVQQRVSYNLKYYSTNYALIIVSLSIYTLLTNWLLLFVLLFTGFGIISINKLNGEDLVTSFGVLKASQLYTALLCVSVPLGFLASPISTLMWLIGTSGVVVLGHASFMEKPIETVFEEQV